MYHLQVEAEEYIAVFFTGPCEEKAKTDQVSNICRGIRNPRVKQCLGFCSDDSYANEDQKSAVQNPNIA